jgi:hypothetical protein
MNRRAWIALFVTLCGTLGCGGSGVDVDGTVVKDGKPYALTEGESININLQSDGATGTASVEKDGHFVAKKSDGKSLPPGKYKVSIVHYPPPPAGGAKMPPQPKPKDAGETWDVSSSNKTFTLDLAKYK